LFVPKSRGGGSRENRVIKEYDYLGRLTSFSNGLVAIERRNWGRTLGHGTLHAGYGLLHLLF